MSDDRHDDPGNESNESNEQFDRWLHASVRDYNRPRAEALPHDVRQDMWRAIARALPATTASTAAPTTVPATVPTTAPPNVVTARPPVRAHRVARPWWLMAAAVLLLAAGIGIGRQWRGATSQIPSVASAGSPDGSATPTTDSPGSSASRPVTASATAEQVGEQVGERADASGRATPMGTSRPGNASYDVAAVAHLSRAEALLTSFRGPQESGGDTSAERAPMNRWARDLLADTRLLLDSPAASDARRRALLEDLEMVLAQIVQLPAESSADRSQVQRSIERGAVLSRLRSSIPAGFSSGT